MCFRDVGTVLVLELCISAGSMCFVIYGMLMAQGAVYRLQEPPWRRMKAAVPPVHHGNGQGEVKKRERSSMNLH